MTSEVHQLALLWMSLHNGCSSNEMLNFAHGTAGKNKDNEDVNENDDEENV
jgi:hypothetical protein